MKAKFPTMTVLRVTKNGIEFINNKQEITNYIDKGASIRVDYGTYKKVKIGGKFLYYEYDERNTSSWLESNPDAIFIPGSPLILLPRKFAVIEGGDDDYWSEQAIKIVVNTFVLRNVLREFDTVSNNLALALKRVNIMDATGGTHQADQLEKLIRTKIVNLQAQLIEYTSAKHDL